MKRIISEWAKGVLAFFSIYTGLILPADLAVRVLDSIERWKFIPEGMQGYIIGALVVFLVVFYPFIILRRLREWFVAPRSGRATRDRLFMHKTR